MRREKASEVDRGLLLTPPVSRGRSQEGARVIGQICDGVLRHVPQLALLLSIPWEYGLFSRCALSLILPDIFSPPNSFPFFHDDIDGSVTVRRVSRHDEPK